MAEGVELGEDAPAAAVIRFLSSSIVYEARGREDCTNGRGKKIEDKEGNIRASPQKKEERVSLCSYECLVDLSERDV
jgi:hypothetical protein